MYSVNCKSSITEFLEKDIFANHGKNEMAGKLKLTGEIAEIAKMMLKKVCTILEENDVPYVLEAGTLLGVVREKRLLPWDNDLDVTITSSSSAKLLSIRWKFWLAGYRTRIRRYKNDLDPFKKGQVRILKIQTRKYFFLKDYSLLDIFVKYPVEDDYCWMVAPKDPVLKAVPREFYDKRTQFEFDGKLYWVPEDYESFLEYSYGDWRTPVKEWEFRLGDNCVRKVYGADE
jgi:phosphorylcholine metabolism protein LicD